MVGLWCKEAAVENDAADLSSWVTGSGVVLGSVRKRHLPKYLQHRGIQSRGVHARSNKRKGSRSRCRGTSAKCQVQAELWSRVRSLLLLPKVEKLWEQWSQQPCSPETGNRQGRASPASCGKTWHCRSPRGLHNYWQGRKTYASFQPSKYCAYTSLEEPESWQWCLRKCNSQAFCSWAIKESMGEAGRLPRACR